jgi:hypothetical protein
MKLEQPVFIAAVHDDGRRIMVGPVRTEAGIQRLKASIHSMGWYTGTPMPRMAQQAWFEMAYRERAALTGKEVPDGQ